MYRFVLLMYECNTRGLLTFEREIVEVFKIIIESDAQILRKNLCAGSTETYFVKNT
jgi:hypothetical protein